MTYRKEKRAMEYVFSDSLAELRPSAIREIFKSLGDPEMIAFAAGNPSPEAFPVGLVRRECARILEEQPIEALQYGTTEGYTPLRRAIEARLTERFGHCADGNDVIVTTGGEQGIELACKALCNPGDAVLCEEPSFIGALNSFRSLGAVPVGVPMDADGINVAAFEEAAVRTGARLAYLIPTFQNPSGITMSAEKRRAIYEVACRRGIMLIEDNPYGELRFAGSGVDTIKSIDEEGAVIYCSSFSKILAPGIRVGYVQAARAVVSKMVVAKQVEDVHTPMLTQLIAHAFMQSGTMDEHIRSAAQLYGRKCALMLSCLDRSMPKQVTYTRPEGGLFLWCTYPEEVDITALTARLLEEKVAVVPGSAFCSVQGGVSHSMRLNYSTPSDEQIERGVEILARVSRELLAVG